MKYLNGYMEGIQKQLICTYLNLNVIINEVSQWIWFTVIHSLSVFIRKTPVSLVTAIQAEIPNR